MLRHDKPSCRPSSSLLFPALSAAVVVGRISRRPRGRPGRGTGLRKEGALMITKTLRSGAVLSLLALLLGACSQSLIPMDNMTLLQTAINVGAGVMAPSGSPASALGAG